MQIKVSHLPSYGVSLIGAIVLSTMCANGEISGGRRGEPLEARPPLT